ncbi:RNA polymerase sigma factor [Rhodobacteraceae bacterium 2CG4]|uniref:RNA polymerase sigma factor n=1 Tax=Halovulum marinum TaxID=2662447 RepID=A0A6L5YVM7_9RHOB|nr:RNA polymerase sigma factor [Halovulum marinum]MSU88298.1 RNA polymerase sigma factor [Halovulum marinum]
MTDEPDPERARDAALLAAYAAGDARAARSLVETHAPRALAVARRMLGSAAEAEEVAQEAMLRLWRIAPEWRAGEARISTWLYRVVANLCTDRLRRARTVPLPEGHDPPDERPGAVAGLIEGQRAAALARALADLPERQRLAVTLRHLEERPNPEIAAIMGLSVDAVESLQARGRKRLRALLAGTELNYHEG